MELSAQKRSLTGKKVKSLRKKGNVPAVLFSRDSSRGQKEVQNLVLNLGEFKKVYKEAGESSLVKVIIDAKDSVNVLISEVQLHPVHLEPIHIGLYEVDMKAEIETEIPVEVINEELCVPVQSTEGILITVLSHVSIKCLPMNIPHNLEADASKLTEVGAVLKVSDLKIDTSKVEIISDLDEVVLKVDFAQQLEVAEETTASVEDVEVITGAAKEGEESAESTETDEADKKE